jgi:NAD(P)-dependent dehydrogenase (short-subunit alcohol dehydrogenase family)
MEPPDPASQTQVGAEMSLAHHAGRTAVVTGAGRGIGRAIAVSLAEAGARVIILGRDPQRLEEACLGFTAHRGSGTMEALPGDLTIEGTVDDLLTRVSRIDILVHNAAAYAPYALLEHSNWDDLVPVWNTVVVASLRLTRRVLPLMKTQRFGRILFVGSAAASVGAAGQVAYVTAKSSLVGMTRSLACETAESGITCNLLEVGLVDTERLRTAVTPERQHQLLTRVPVGRLATPKEIARVATFLTSDDAGYLTGATIPVTGGLGLGLFPFSVEGSDANR